MQMEEKRLLLNLKKKSKKLMKNGRFFHDFAHVLAVYKNVARLLKYKKADKLVLLTTALFHDIKRDCENHGYQGGILTKDILEKTSKFPPELIVEVVRIIDSHDKFPKKHDEKLFYDADKMDAFNEFGMVRSFMMFALEGMTLKKACSAYLELIDKFYKNLNFPISKKIVSKDYKKIRKLTFDFLKRYDY